MRVAEFRGREQTAAALAQPATPAVRSRLALYLALGYTLLILYASLSPFTGWRDPGRTPFEFVTAPLPRYIVAFDLIVNVLAYVPQGFLVTLALLARLRPWLAGTAGALLGIALSLALETVQGYLPARVSNNVDLGTNALGALIGAFVAARFGSLPGIIARLRRWRTQWFRDGSATELAIALLALWFFSQLDPSRPLLGIVFFSEGVQAQLAGLATRAETKVLGSASVAITLLSLGLFLMRIMRSRRRAMIALGLLVGIAALIKLIAATFLLKREAAFLWFSRDVVIALAAGALLVVSASLLPRRMIGPACALSLASAIALALPRPDHRAAFLSLRLFQLDEPQILHYNALAAAVAEAWPYAALLVLAVLWRRDRHAG